MDVDTRNGVIVFANGKRVRYELVRQRRWNPGYKRHISELTGEIRLEGVRMLFPSFAAIGDLEQELCA